MPSVLDIAEQRIKEEELPPKKGSVLDQAEYEYYMNEPAPVMSVLDQAEAQLKKETEPQKETSYELSEDNFFKAYYKWLHTPTEKATGMWDWLNRVLPKSVYGTAVAVAEFPYFTIKAFTDPLIEGIEKVVNSKATSIEDYRRIQREAGWDTTKKVGKAAWELINGMSQFFGEPIGIYGWEKMKDKWLSDPAAGALALVPLIKGGVAQGKPITQNVSEFGRTKGLQKVYDWIDVQAPLNRVGAKKTGIAFKRFPSVRNVEQQHAIRKAKEIQQLNIPPEHGLEITLKASGSRHATNLHPETTKAANIVKDYYNQAFIRLKSDGVLQNPWPKSQILRNDKKIETLTEQIIKDTEAINKERAKRGETIRTTSRPGRTTRRTKTEIEGRETTDAPEITTRLGVVWKDRIREAMKTRGFSDGEINTALHHIRGDQSTTARIGEVIKEKTTETIKTEKITEIIIERVKPDINKIRNLRKKVELNRNQINELNGINQHLKTLKPQYTHIPLNEWYSKIRDTFGEQSGDFIWNKATSSFFKGRFFKNRKTVDVGDFIENLKKLTDEKGKPVFETLDFDARTTMASYAQKTGRMRGLAKIFNNAYKEGLIINKRGLPPNGFGEVPFEMSITFPELKNRYINNAFLERLSDYTKRIDSGMQLGRIMGYTKMMAFYNPFFLPIYDTWQASWAMGPQLANPKYWNRAIKSFKNRDVAYWQAAESGAFSTPYTPPFKNFKADMVKTIEGRMLPRIIQGAKTRSKNPAILVDDFYRGVWNIAWGGDNAIRLVTNHYLRDKGYSPLEAGQLTAYFHGDYARLTPAARKILNKILFTPSFKYTMGHVQANMVKSSIKVMDNAMRLKKSAKRDKLLAKGAGMLIAGSMAKNFLMEKLGFNTDDFGLRYSKTVDTDEGEKELILYWPDPNNTILRQVLKWTNWSDDPDKMDAAIRKISWDLHPVWRLSAELLHNQKTNGDLIYNIFDSNGKLSDSHIIAKDVLHYSVSRLVAASGFVEEYIGSKDKKSAYKQMQQEVGFVWEKFLSAATLAYLRDPKDIRFARQVQKLQLLFKQTLRKDEPKTDEEADRRIDNFWKRIEDIEKEMGE